MIWSSVQIINKEEMFLLRLFHCCGLLSLGHNIEGLALHVQNVGHQGLLEDGRRHAWGHSDSGGGLLRYYHVLERYRYIIVCYKMFNGLLSNVTIQG